MTQANVSVELQNRMVTVINPQPRKRRCTGRWRQLDVMAEGNDLFGDGVHIAARIEDIAEPGGALVSSTAFAYGRNKGKIGFEDLSAQILKNIVESVRTYRVVAVITGARNILPCALGNLRREC